MTPIHLRTRVIIAASPVYWRHWTEATPRRKSMVYRAYASVGPASYVRGWLNTSIYYPLSRGV